MALETQSKTEAQHAESHTEKVQTQTHTQITSTRLFPPLPPTFSHTDNTEHQCREIYQYFHKIKGYQNINNYPASSGPLVTTCVVMCTSGGQRE